MRLFTATIAVLLMAGCASQPKDMTASAPAAAPPTATAPAAKVAPAAETASKTAATKVYPGYKQKTRNGTTVYCKKIAKIGSNFQDETCLTAAEMEDMMSKADQDRESFRRNQTICGGGNCGGG